MASLNNVNKVILIGQLGASPELRHTAKGNPVVNLAIATNRSWKTEEGNWQELTEWHQAVVWGKRAEACSRYLQKGNRVYVEGVIQTNTWKDAGGQQHWRTEVLVDEIKFLGGPARYAAAVSANGATEENSSSADEKYTASEALPN